MTKRLAIAAFTLAALAASPAAADMLVFHDGRFVDGRDMEKLGDVYRIHYEHGDIDVPADRVKDFFDFDDDGQFVPQTEEERTKLAEGKVPWRGRWVSIKRRDKAMQKQIDANLKRLEQEKVRKFWRNHATVEGKQFIFKFTLADDHMQEYIDLFHTYYEVFAKEWKIRPKSKNKPTIHIYHDKEYFHQVSGAQRGVAGWYRPATQELHFYYSRERPRFTIDVMFHEGNHMITHMIALKVWYPAWINEGLGEYYGASEWNAEDKEMTVGGIQSARLAVMWDEINDDKWQGLRELIYTPRINATQYAWAWSFCHFLMQNEKYAKRFKKYYLALGRGKVKRKQNGDMWVIDPNVQVEHLLKYLKVKSLDQLQDEWYDYIENELKLDRNDIDWEGAGWIMELKGEHALARKYFKKAIDAGSESAFVYYGYAKLQFNRGKQKSALKRVGEALEHDPLHPQARFLQGRIRYRNGDEHDGTREMKLAMELDPYDHMMGFHLLQEQEATKEGKQRGN